MIRGPLSFILLNFNSGHWAYWNSFKGTHSWTPCEVFITGMIKIILIIPSTIRESQLMNLKGSIQHAALLHGCMLMPMILPKLPLLCVTCCIFLCISSQIWVNFSDEYIIQNVITTKLFRTHILLMDTYIQLS